MANTCFNELYFTGEGERVKQANLFLAGLPTDEWGGAKIEGTNGYFQDLYFGQGKFLFGTRWVPDMVTVQAIADRFRVGFTLDYTDPMMSLYGQARYENGRFSNIRLGVDDYAKVKYLPRKDVYEYQDRVYRNLDTLSRELLKEKIRMEQPAKQQHRLKQRPS